MYNKMVEISKLGSMLLLHPWTNCMVPHHMTSSWVESSNAIYEMELWDVEGNNSWQVIIWRDVVESSIQLLYIYIKLGLINHALYLQKCFFSSRLHLILWCLHLKLIRN